MDGGRLEAERRTTDELHPPSLTIGGSLSGQAQYMRATVGVNGSSIATHAVFDVDGTLLAGER